MKYCIGLLLLLNTWFVNAQLNGSIDLKIKSSKNFPALQSFVVGTYDDYWLLAGGRHDGLHARQPFASFDSLSRNHMMYVYLPQKDSLIMADISYLSDSIRHQLYSANMQFAQIGQTLFACGGYGYYPPAETNITFDKLLIFNIPQTIENILHHKKLDSTCLTSMTDDIFRVAGGKMLEFDNHLILLGGHDFQGFYNPVGNPSYQQKYNHTLYEFEYNQTTQSINILHEVMDSIRLHRRDFNASVAHQQDGDRLIIYSGVFRRDGNFPYQNLIEYHDGKLYDVPIFRQRLANYHTANIQLLNKYNQDFTSVFIGGIAMYYQNEGKWYYDSDVPFVNQISMVTRHADGSYTEEYNKHAIPWRIGTAAEVVTVVKDGVLQYDSSTHLPQTIGYILGGINSKDKNIFWTDEDSTSHAATQLIEISFISNKDSNAICPYSNSPYDIEIFPNSDFTHFTFSWNQKANERIFMQVFSPSGKKLFSQYFDTRLQSRQTIDIKGEIMEYPSFRFEFQSPTANYSYWVMNND